MRALITGITGFVGQHLAEHLVACGDQVMGSVWGDSWSRDVHPAVRLAAPVFAWDLTQPFPAACARVTRTVRSRLRLPLGGHQCAG